MSKTASRPRRVRTRGWVSVDEYVRVNLSDIHLVLHRAGRTGLEMFCGLRSRDGQFRWTEERWVVQCPECLRAADQ